ncbi:hypothetical protein BpHYR1_041678 [Brachionus plicatilis]|uniref:Uncharacterized protein n=1 Tax=Brachionus plicatilis TaxID=10195 RepID=A0A3M7STQ1_BRAPC|nr:hypothetical protein BpHYR1_041678 [Brachionus plicatilis]
MISWQTQALEFSLSLDYKVVCKKFSYFLLQCKLDMLKENSSSVLNYSLKKLNFFKIYFFILIKRKIINNQNNHNTHFSNQEKNAIKILERKF